MNRRIRFFLIVLSSVGLLCISEITYAQHYAEESGWSFQNFTTSELSWEIFRDTFIGVPPTIEAAASGFDPLFYNQVYKDKLSANGNCYGMALQSLLMVDKGGHLGFCWPVNQYSGDLVGTLPGGDTAGPSDSRLYRVINEMHGYQVNLPSLKFYLEIINIGKSRDGLYAFDQVKYYQMRDDPVLVSITKSWNPVDGGHTLAVYDAVEYSANDKRIYLYDPNRSAHHSVLKDWYSMGLNYIQIRSDHSWTFEMKSSSADVTNTTTWSGDPSSGGNIIISPVSIVGPRARTPSSMGLDVLNFINEFFIFGDGASLEQVETSDGKRLFKPGTKELDIDPATGMLSMVPWFPSDQNTESSSFASYFLLGNPGSKLDIKIRGGSNGYRLDVGGIRSHLQINAIGGKGVDRITLKQPGSIKPEVVLHNTIGAEKYDIIMSQIVKPSEETRVFKMTGIAVPVEKPLELKIVKNQSGLQVKSLATDLIYNLDVSRITKTGETLVNFAEVRLNTEIQTIRPPDWNNLIKENAFIKVYPINDLIIQP